LMPDKSLNIRGEACTGEKKSEKDWQHCCAAMLREQKRWHHLLLESLWNLGVSKNISTLPCKYTNNSNARVMANIFLNFLCQSDARMGSSNSATLCG
jgi:hypothetical protein